MSHNTTRTSQSEFFVGYWNATNSGRPFLWKWSILLDDSIKIQDGLYEKTVYRIIPKTHLRWSIVFHSCHTSMITTAEKNKHHTAFPMLISFKPQVTMSYMQSEVNRLEMHYVKTFQYYQQFYDSYKFLLYRGYAVLTLHCKAECQ